MAVTGIAQLAVMLARSFVPLHADPSPVIASFTHPLIATVAHLNSFCFAALFVHGRKTGIGAQTGAIFSGKQVAGSARSVVAV